MKALIESSRRYLPPLLALVVSACSTANGSTPAVLVKPLSQGVVNDELGDMLNANARMRAAEAEYKALETGQTGMPVEWRVSDNVFGKVVPQQPFTVGKTDCRRYVHTVSNRGEVRSAAGTACRGADGVWQPVS